MILDGKYVPDLLVMLPKPPGDVPDTRTKHGAFPFFRVKCKFTVSLKFVLRTAV